MTQIVIWGCGGHGREVNLLCEQAGVKVDGFLDERTHMKGQVVDDVSVLGVLDDIAHLRHPVGIVCAGVGDPALKKRFAEATIAAGFEIADPIVHPNVQISRRCNIGRGTVVMAGSILTVNIIIGSHVILNMNSTIAHDVTIGNYVTISPGANVSGRVVIEEGAFIGTNASIKEGVTIGCWSVVGAGSFVREDVPPHTMVAGVPATVKRQLA